MSICVKNKHHLLQQHITEYIRQQTPTILNISQIIGSLVEVARIGIISLIVNPTNWLYLVSCTALGEDLSCSNSNSSLQVTYSTTQPPQWYAKNNITLEYVDSDHIASMIFIFIPKGVTFNTFYSNQ